MPLDAMLAVLKRNAPMTLRALREELGVSETTVRHHLSRLVRDGLVEVDARRSTAVGRPAALYGLTPAAEGVFPKQYVQLLEAVLGESESLGVIDALFERIAEALAVQLRTRIVNLRGERALRALLDGIDYGDMLATCDAIENGWILRAHNCLYHAAGQRFVEVCDLLPTAITKTGSFYAERVACQRDDRRSCDFFIAPK